MMEVLDVDKLNLVEKLENVHLSCGGFQSDLEKCILQLSEMRSRAPGPSLRVGMEQLEKECERRQFKLLVCMGHVLCKAETKEMMEANKEHDSTFVVKEEKVLRCLEGHQESFRQLVPKRR